MSVKAPIFLNADTAVPAFMPALGAKWLPSPEPGVERRMLERDGGEVARATSIVRYAPGSSFAHHRHDDGEEYFVLEGIFSDAEGHHGVGTYVRNPPGSSHAPFSEGGCTIFVKLRQMRPEQDRHVRTDCNAAAWMAMPGGSYCELYVDPWERVRLYRLGKGARHVLESQCGIEMLVLSGTCNDAERIYRELDWLRLPGPAEHIVEMSAATTLLIKTTCRES